MKAEIKSYGRMNSKGYRGTPDRCGKLILTAQNEADAALLALIGRVMSGVGLKKSKDSRYRLFMHLLHEAVEFPTEIHD